MVHTTALTGTLICEVTDIDLVCKRLQPPGVLLCIYPIGQGKHHVTQAIPAVTTFPSLRKAHGLLFLVQDLSWTIVATLHHPITNWPRSPVSTEPPFSCYDPSLHNPADSAVVQTYGVLCVPYPHAIPWTLLVMQAYH